MYGVGWLSIIVLLFGSMIASYGFIVSKRPEAKELLDKLVPFQGFIGIALLIWGIIQFIDSVKYWGLALEYAFFTGLLMILYVLLCIVLGFLLGYGLIAKYVLSKNDSAMEKGQAAIAKLTKIQNPLGILGIVISLILIFYRF